VGTQCVEMLTLTGGSYRVGFINPIDGIVDGVWRYIAPISNRPN
jgi:hypothetical protein